MTYERSSGLRVGMLTEAHPASAETFVARQAKALGSPVACAVDPGFPSTGHEFPPVISLTGGKPISSGRGPLVLQRILVRVFGEPTPSWAKPTELAFREWLRDGQFDVLLAQFGPNGVRAHRACSDLEIPLVVQFFGQDASALLRRHRYVAALTPLFEYAAAVVVMSSDMRDRLVAYGCPREKIHVIPVGVPTDRLAPSQGVASQPCRFLAAHRWVPKKGLLETLRAFRHCRESVLGVSLDLVGGGMLEGQVRDFLQANHLTDAVRLHGSIPNSVLRERFLERAGCLVQHSRVAPNGDREGWPVVIAEAAAASLPVVATRHAAIPEQVIDGETGFLVEEGDVAAMASRMIELAGHPEKRKRMGQAARKHICSVGSLRRQLDRLTVVLRAASALRP